MIVKEECRSSSFIPNTLSVGVSFGTIGEHMRVLVTGGSGYLGAVLSGVLRMNGHQVSIFDLRAPTSEDAHWIAGDVRDQLSLVKAIDTTDAVIHLAAIVGYPACDRAPHLAEEINIGGTKTVAESVQGRPWVFLSTASLYGGRERVYQEQMHVVPRTVYSRTKYEAEHIGRNAGAVCLRPVSAFGVSPCMRWDLLLHNWVRQGTFTGEVTVYEPNVRRSFVHIYDLAFACLLGLEKWQILQGGIWNVSAIDVTKQELAEAVARITHAEVRAAPGVDQEERWGIVSADAFRAHGWVPTRTLAEGMQEVHSFLSRGSRL